MNEDQSRKENKRVMPTLNNELRGLEWVGMNMFGYLKVERFSRDIADFSTIENEL